MSARFLCPHCHCSIDRRSLEAATDDANEYHICPECDAAVPSAHMAQEAPPLAADDAVRSQEGAACRV